MGKGVGKSIGKSTGYRGGERRAEEQERLLTMDRLAGAVETLVEQNGDNQRTMGEVKDEVTGIRLDIQKLTLNQKAFIRTYDNQVISCEKIHTDVETRLREAPTALVCTDHKDRIKKLESFKDKATKHIYKFIGVMFVVTLIITIAAPWALKKWG